MLEYPTRATALVAVLALPLHPILELALDFVERTVGGSVSIFGSSMVGSGIARDNFVAGQAEVDRDAKPVSVRVVVSRQFDDGVTRNDAVEEPLELVGTLPNSRSESVRMRHASKCDLKGNLHSRYLRAWGMHESCARRRRGEGS